VSATLVALARPPRTRTRTYNLDKPPVFVVVDRGTDHQYIVPAKSTDKSTIWLLLAARQQELLPAYTDGFRAYEPLEKDDTFG